ncbi:CBS domain-containing protein [Actinophytocola sp. NPDC049390]|uniref:CBS domain-containing protein n=1 Tax=Actinophytocola sp. NPDC049390 TaxID=3363894 RepID=UPI0037933AB0
MREPTVADLMTRQVVTVVPDTPFRELVGTMLAHDLHALPVIDLTGHPIGVVTDVDTLTKLEYHGGTDYLPLLAGAGCRARWRKAPGINATHLMSTPAPTVAEDTPVAAALHALADVGDVYVVDTHGILIGTVTRCHVLPLLLRSDLDVQADLERDIRVPAYEVGKVTIQVTGGVVTLTGKLRLRSTADSVCWTAQRTPGVVTVHNNLRHDIDDSLITGL